MKLALAVFLVMAIAGAAQGQDQPPLSGKDVTIKIQPGSDPQRFYPQDAQRRNIEGQATALCVVGAKGRLTECVVTAASPDGFGFGEAIVHTASLLEVAAKAKDGSPTVGRKFEFHLNFRLPRG
jgi:TonB family protein